MNTQYCATRFPTLFYANLGRSFWSFFVKDEGDTHYARVGPNYATKAELLGDLTRYARDYGLEAPVSLSDKLRSRQSKSHTERTN
jgi:hypothetical protein